MTMPKMTCATDRVIETTLGHVFQFKKGVPLHVPRHCVAAVMEKGAYPADEESKAETTEVTETAKTKTQLEPTDLDERHELLVKAIRDLHEKGELVMTAGNKPNPQQLMKATGLRIDAAERDAAWDVVKAALADD
jgi:hypothetical protein